MIVTISKGVTVYKDIYKTLNREVCNTSKHTYRVKGVCFNLYYVTCIN